MNNTKYHDLLSRIYKLIETRQSNSENLILNRFSMGKLWDMKYEDDKDLFILTTLKQHKSMLQETNIPFHTFNEVYKFINDNWEMR